MILLLSFSILSFTWIPGVSGKYDAYDEKVQSCIVFGDQQSIMLYLERVFVLALQSSIGFGVYTLTIKCFLFSQSDLVMLHLSCSKCFQPKWKYKQNPVPGLRSSSLCLLLPTPLEGIMAS